LARQYKTYSLFIVFRRKIQATNIKRSLSFSMTEIISSNISFVG